MPARGFCEHGKVWTTCPVCGKEVIAAQANRRGGDLDEFGEVRKKAKKVAARPVGEEGGEEPIAEGESSEGES